MPALRDLYANSAKSGFTIDFFSLSAPGAHQALLASPFFSTYEPIRALTERGCTVKLLVRLCSITTPNVLREALADSLVTVRYYTAQTFHAKFYLIDDKALVGSANLTTAGLKTNSEVSIVLHRDRDPSFEELTAVFVRLWEFADVLTGDILDTYQQAFRSEFRPSGKDDFDKILASYIPPCAPPNIRVGSDRVSGRRSFLQTFRRKYDEAVWPAFDEVRRLFLDAGLRRPDYEDSDLDIELGRFLGWVRLIHAPGENWSLAPLLDRDARAQRIMQFGHEWLAAEDLNAGDAESAQQEIGNITRIRENFASADSIRALSYDEIFDALAGCHAFHEQLRFTEGGLDGFRLDFHERNALTNIQDTLVYLLHGPNDVLERAYDCIHDERYKLARFSEACIMELTGWMDPSRPPINGRTIKALRFLGFDVRD